MATTAETVTAAVRGIGSALRAVMEPEIECDGGCGSDVHGGEVVVLDGLLLGVSCGCAWARASSMLEPLLNPVWTSVEIEGGRRDFEEARDVVRALLARIDARLGRTS